MGHVRIRLREMETLGNSTGMWTDEEIAAQETMTWHGMPRRGLTVSGKRVTYVVPKGPVIETPCLPPLFLPNAPPRRTQMAKVFFNDGTSRMAEVIL